LKSGSSINRSSINPAYQPLDFVLLQAMISVTNLSHRFSNGTTLAFPDMRVEKGAHTLLLGESGSGKTTLLHLLGGLLKVKKGKIEIENTDISLLSGKDLDKFRGRNIGFVFQRNHLIPSLTVKQNLMLPGFLASYRNTLKEIQTILDKLGLSAYLNANLTTLSQGQLQRVAIARAVLNKPKILLADEPTSALDDKNCGRVITLLQEVAVESNCTLVVATHDHRLKSFVKDHLLLNTAAAIV
jgi:ABC-type lipoprotein export system ATPase subunit